MTVGKCPPLPPWLTLCGFAGIRGLGGRHLAGRPREARLSQDDPPLRGVLSGLGPAAGGDLGREQARQRSSVDYDGGCGGVDGGSWTRTSSESSWQFRDLAPDGAVEWGGATSEPARRPQDDGHWRLGGGGGHDRGAAAAAAAASCGGTVDGSGGGGGGHRPGGVSHPRTDEAAVWGAAGHRLGGPQSSFVAVGRGWRLPAPAHGEPGTGPNSGGADLPGLIWPMPDRPEWPGDGGQ